MDLDLLLALAIGLAILGGALALVMRSMLRQRSNAGFNPGFNPGAPAIQAIPTTRLGGEGWLAAAPLLEAMSMTKLNAECFTRDLSELGSHALYLKVDVGQGSLRAWLDRPCPGGMLEMYLGAEATVNPGEQGRSALAQFVAFEVREALSTLPRQATLKVKAPEIPGDKFNLAIETPFTAPEQAATVARILLMLDAAAQRPAPAGSEAKMPPAAMCWVAAIPALEALGLTKLDAECYTRDIGGLITQALYIKVNVRNGSIRGWLDRPGQGGMLEMFLGAKATLSPGEPGRTELAHFVAGEIREVMGVLPRQAQLTVKAPEIPGDKYNLSLETPFSTPDQAAIVARVLLKLDEAAQRPAPQGAHAKNMPPAAMCWMAAIPALEAMGLKKLDAECYTREIGGLVTQALYIKVNVRDGSLRGWLERPGPGGTLEMFLGAETALSPGEQGRTELAHFVAGRVHDVLGALPRQASLTVKAPQIPGDKYSLSLETPFSTPDQAATLARVLLMLDEAAQGTGVRAAR